MTQTLNVYKEKKNSLIKCIDSRGSLINLLCGWSKTVRGAETFINHAFGNWKLMMEVAFEGSNLPYSILKVNAVWQKLEKSDNKREKTEFKCWYFVLFQV